MRPIPAALLIAASVLPSVPLLPAAGELAAQEIVLSVGAGRSGFGSLDSPGVLSVELGLPVLPFVRVVGGWRRVREVRRFDGTTCDSYWPGYEGCLEERIEREARVGQWQAGVRIGGRVHRFLELHAGLAAVRSSLTASSRGRETGRRTGDYFPERPVWGTALALEARTGELLGDRLGLSGRLQTQRLDFEGCVTDAGTPFCGSERLTTLEVGVVLGSRAR